MKMRKMVTTFIAASLILTTPMISLSEEAQDTYLSEDIQNACVEVGEIYDICPELLMAIIETESSGNQYAESKGCKGLMQVNSKLHSDRMAKLGVTDIYDIKGNIMVGTDLLHELAEKYEELPVVLMKYHGERNAATKPVSKYAQNIMNRSEELETLHESNEIPVIVSVNEPVIEDGP